MHRCEKESVISNINKKLSAKRKTSANTKKTDKKPKSSPQKGETPASFPVVGVGASAGGLEAFSALLLGLPEDTGMAFVLIQHLAPAHTSALPDLLRRATLMPVMEIKDGLRITANHVYVIPPNANVGIQHGRLYLQPREAEAGRYLPIDYFLKSLAHEQGDNAIGIILSGTASDGVLGLKEIKAAGGITFAQDEESAEYNGMPHSAIAAGVVDFVMPPAQIAAQLVYLRQHPYLANKNAGAISEEQGEAGDELSKIFSLLRQQTGNDFTYYKPSTIQRRIKRRMALHKLDQLEDYIRLLQRTPAEVDALFHDILIHVTGFFRDPEVFEVLQQQVFPELMAGRAPGVPIRIWVPGCSSGEEVYSLVICLLEFLGERINFTPIQVFGTDLDDQAIDYARQGIFPESIVQSVSPERLRLFFLKVEQGYQINRQVRDRCVFSRHNVLSDPAFSKMDLISCRNLLIYLGPVLQKKVLQILHYALNPQGILVLGASETIGRYADLFALADKKQKIYVKKTALLATEPQLIARDKQPAMQELNQVKWPPQSWTTMDLQREVDRMLLRKFAPPGVVVDEDLTILQFRGQTGAFLEPAPGEASLKLLKMARNGLAMELANMTRDALRSNNSVRRTAIKVYSSTGSRYITLEVDPVRVSPSIGQYLLVTFQEKAPPAPLAVEMAHPGPATGEESTELLQLRQELIASKEYLQSTIEQQEVTNEELTSANEEIQASNEELQSINEELETAKEELQSTNEELVTINNELEVRNNELEQLNNDLGNLLGGMATAIIMVDKGLRIRRYTTEAEQLLNLQPASTGQPITQTNLSVVIPDFERRLHQVIDNMISQELELQDVDAHWYRVRLRPYKTIDNKIDGAVLAFVDIDILKQSLAQAEQARDYAEAIVAALRTPLLILDHNLQVVSASASYYETFHVSPEQTVGNLLYRLGNAQWGIPQLRRLLESCVHDSSGFEEYVVEHDFESIGHRVMTVSGRQIPGVATTPPMVLMQIEDITDKTRHDENN
jgi:two-component system CheB/CheR fusion protein